MGAKKETHLFIIWSNARYREKEILEIIGKKLTILGVIEVTWSLRNFSNNLSRFYGQKLPDRSFKEKHCGKGPFILVICDDLSPVYGERDTVSRSVEIVNQNLFDLKHEFRAMTGGGHKIHATNNPTETDHDLSLLLGFTGSDYLAATKSSGWDGEISVLKQDLVGADGWASVEQFFYTLNACEEYVVLRNFEDFPHSVTSAEHDDIDFLTNDRESFVFTSNAEKVFKAAHRVHYRISLAGRETLCDVRYVGDGYYDSHWQQSMLAGRVLRDFYFVPNTEDHRYSVLYHALVHKPEIAADYAERLTTWFGTSDHETLRNMLESFMRDRGWAYCEPVDLSVYYGRQSASLKRRAYYKYLKHMSYLRDALRS